MDVRRLKFKRLLRSILSDSRIAARTTVSYFRWNAHGIRTTPDCRVHPGAVIEAPCSFFGSARIHERAVIGAFTYGTDCTIDNAHIGRLCSIAPGARIGLNEHPTDGPATHPLTYDAQVFNAALRPCVLGNDVWVGANAVIRAGVIVGDGAVVAAGSVVNRDVPKHAIVGGVPAHVLRTRQPDEAFYTALASASTEAELLSLADAVRRAFAETRTGGIDPTNVAVPSMTREEQYS